jgi:hypothetical protein
MQFVVRQNCRDANALTPATPHPLTLFYNTYASVLLELVRKQTAGFAVKSTAEEVSSFF